MRILFWADDFGSSVGGAEVWACRYVDAMKERKHLIEVIAADGRDDDPALDCTGGGVLVHRLFAGSALRKADTGTFTACVKQAGTLERSIRPDVVHLSIGMSAPSLMLFLMSRVRAPDQPGSAAPAMLASLHSVWPVGFPLANSPLDKVLHQMDWISCFSQATSNWFLNQWPELSERSNVIRHTLPPRDCVVNSNEESVEEEMTISFVGRFSMEKGADLALTAFSLLRKDFPQLRLVMAGTGMENGRLVALAAELGIAEFVRFVGWLNPAAVRRLIRRSRLVMVPSRLETFGLIVLEAAQEGCPVVATAIGGLPEVCLHEQTGLLCPPEDAPALAAAAARLLANPELRDALGCAAKTRAQAAMSWEQHVDVYEALTQRLIMQRNSFAKPVFAFPDQDMKR